MTKFKRNSTSIKLSNFNKKYSIKFDNIITQALAVKELTKIISYVEAGKKFEISRGRIYQLNKIANKIPYDFLNKFKNYDDPVILDMLSGKKLLDIASLENAEKIYLNIIDFWCYLEVLEKIA